MHRQTNKRHIKVYLEKYNRYLRINFMVVLTTAASDLYYKRHLSLSLKVRAILSDQCQV